MILTIKLSVSFSNDLFLFCNSVDGADVGGSNKPKVAGIVHDR